MLANLRALFGRLVDIILLRRGPEQFAGIAPLLVLMVALNFVAVRDLRRSVVSARRRPMPCVQVCRSSPALVMLLWFRWRFQLAQKRERFLQTMTRCSASSTMFLPLLDAAGRRHCCRTSAEARSDGADRRGPADLVRRGVAVLGAARATCASCARRSSGPGSAPSSSCWRALRHAVLLGLLLAIRPKPA